MIQLQTLINQPNYLDESQLLISEYSTITHVESQPQLDFINKWIIDPTTLPLMILGQPESGKKALIYSVIKRLKQQHKDWVCINHFSSITSNYSHILYKIMIELRNCFKVEQKVDVNQEKLRRYFKYWLNMISDHIEKQYLGYSKSEIPKVVIIIEGIDECQDLKGNKIEPQFWLPSDIPKNIKLILSSKTIKEEERKYYTILQQLISHEKYNKILNNYHPNIQNLKNNKHLTLYEYHIVNQMLTKRTNLQLQGKPFRAILTDYVLSVSTEELTVDQIKSLLYVLTLTRKGLQYKWIKKIVNITLPKWQIFIKYFSFYVLCLDNYYIICNNKAKRLIRELVDPHYQKVKTYRLSISKQIKNEAVCLRELQEIIHQLLSSECYNELKEIISRIQNFVLLYTPLSKNILCQCWVKLQQLEQYDPVFEYNRAIEAFKSQYYPKEEDLYKLIFQISMFFKEYAQFQNARTPSFRHPLIKGEINQLLQIGIYDELKNLSMIGKIKVYNHKPMQKFGQKTINNMQKAEQTLVMKPKSSGVILKQQGKVPVETTRRQKVVHSKGDEVISSEQGTVHEISNQQFQQTPSNPVINVQEINVSIISNQQKFKNFFISSIKEYLEVYFYPHKKSSKQKSFSFQPDQSDNEEESNKDKTQKQIKFDIEKYKKSMLLKSYRDYLQDNYHKSGEQLQFYYYKQWIWLQFPWICQTIKHFYSEMITECHPGTIHFMSPLRECNLIKEVIKITKNAKESKIHIFTSKNIEILSIKYPKATKQSRMTEINDNGRTYHYGRKNTEKYLENGKSKLNLTNIQEEIKTQKKQGGKNGKEKMLKHQTSVPNLVFVTEAYQKEERFLPKIENKLKESLSTKRFQKQNINDCRDYTKLIRKYNELKHENAMLTSKIQQFKKLQSNFTDKTKEEQSILQQDINNMNIKKHQIESQMKGQQDLMKKLEVIIKICDINKMYGSESQHLSLYLSNIKYMIGLEERGIQDIRERLNEMVEAGKHYIKELKAKKKELRCLKEIANSRCLALPLEQIQEELQEMQNLMTRKSKKQRTINKTAYKEYPNYSILQENLGIVYKSAQNEDKIDNFLNKMFKKKELSLRNRELKRQYQIKLRQLQNHTIQIKNMKQGSINQRNLTISSNLIESRRQLQQMKRRNLLLTHAMVTIQSHDNN